MKKIRIAASVMAAAMVFTSGAFSRNIGSSSAIADTGITFEQFDKNINGGEPIRGVDISSIIALEKSGVTFKDENGNEQDIFKTLSEHGVNYIRVRVWNDPYDSNGNGYGGGNNDVYTAGLIGKRAAEYGMKLLVDIHYSDFWADPAKQTRPKYWAEHNNTKLAGEIYKWTSWVLQSVSEAGGDIGMVQVGNETNCFFCGEKDMYEICKLFASGNKAVRDFDKNILIAHHFANPSTGHYDWYAKVMNECKLDYDVFATSYYPYWHGSIENMKKVMKDIGDKYNKYVMVAEVAYPYTNEDGDHFGNSVTSSSSGCDFAYEISVDGQADCLTDVFKAVSEMNGLQQGTVKVGAFSSICTNWMPEIITSFKEKYPAVEIELFQGTYDDVAYWIKNGVVDFGFLSTSSAKDLPIEPFYRDPLLCIVPGNYEKEEPGDFMTISEMSRRRFVVQRESTDADIQNYLKQNQLDISTRYHVVDDLSTVIMVQAGFGICIMPELVMTDIPYDVRMYRMEPDAARMIGLAVRGPGQMAPAARTLYQHILETYRNI